MFPKKLSCERRGLGRSVNKPQVRSCVRTYRERVRTTHLEPCHVRTFYAAPNATIPRPVSKPHVSRCTLELDNSTSRLVISNSTSLISVHLPLLCIFSSSISGIRLISLGEALQVAGFPMGYLVKSSAWSVTGHSSIKGHGHVVLVDRHRGR
jgi:hypothetical protein